MSEPLVSVIIPVMNEAAAVQRCIVAARDGYDTDEVEIIVSDGGSSDGTPEAVPSDVRVIIGSRGRAVQMNRGAAESRGQILLFCHADSLLPAGWREAVIAALAQRGISGGVFSTRILPDDHWVLWLRNRLPQTRHWQGMHGDQCQFMRRSTFQAAGGYPALPIMEDVEMSRVLSRIGQMVRLPEIVLTSSRRYYEHGVTRQALRNRWNLFRYLYLRRSAEDIARTYRTAREQGR